MPLGGAPESGFRVQAILAKQRGRGSNRGGFSADGSRASAEVWSWRFGKNGWRRRSSEVGTGLQGGVLSCDWGEL